MKNACILFLAIMLLMTGCETTGDPKQGGLWGWSEKKAVVRQNDLQTQLNAEQSNTQAIKETASGLESAKQSKTMEVAALHAEITQLDADLDKINKKISGIKASTAATSKKKTDALAKANKLKQEIKTLQASPSGDVQKKQQRIRELRADIDKLLNLVNAQ